MPHHHSPPSRRRFLMAAGGAMGLSAFAPAVRGAEPAELPSDGPFIDVPKRKLPVLARADVVVCGGGTAGVAAACCAARHGAKVVLLERWPSVGGMATNALVNIWHTSDRTRQVIFGFVQEVIERGGSFVHRMGHFPNRPETHWFDPEGMKVVLHDLLDHYKVQTLCNLQAVESIVDDGRVRGVLVDSKTGRKAVLGRIVIDATGDGDVAANAGIPYDFGRGEDGLVQGMTMMFCLCNVDTATVRAAPPEKATAVHEAMRRLRDAGKFPPFNEGAALHYLRTGRNHHPYNMTPAAGNPLDEADLTRLSIEARRRVYQTVDFWKREMPGFATAEVEQMGFGLGVRESRRIQGRKTLDGEMVVKAAKQPDAMGHGFWMIDIHDPKGTGYTTWTDQAASLMPPVGESYHIPLGMCLNSHIPNLAVVGRCASSTHEAHASVRLQSHCMVMGQGVGTAAAIALQKNVDMAELDLAHLQAVLRDDGVYLADVPDA